MTSCAGNMSYGGGYTDATGLPMPLNSTLPRNFSSTSSSSSRSSMMITNDDFRELMRAASKRTLEDNFGIESPQQRFSPAGMVGAAPSNGMGMVPRSRSHTVGIARIDEDKPCDFAEDNNSLNTTTNLFYPRSRSCATVTKRPVLSRHY
ncbi:uncharacterized protein LOC122658142 [Telopea speciosissima]|uniref:uncharacterized protein LOC122658142 n=1 Tax=Telopea speciosissima TaxID=54955 RepID=UPI001CC6E63C|nr:uncharacterized protein LOC122658142 [Telopea speciosissima]